MAPRLSGQTSIFGVVFFVFKSLLGIEGQRKLVKFAILTRKPRSHIDISNIDISNEAYFCAEQAVIDFVMQAASTLENTDGERRISASWNFYFIKKVVLRQVIWLIPLNRTTTGP